MTARIGIRNHYITKILKYVHFMPFVLHASLSGHMAQLDCKAVGLSSSVGDTISRRFCDCVGSCITHALLRGAERRWERSVMEDEE
jgi:hypothetical protein